MKHSKLLEGSIEKHFMTPREITLRKKLIALLKDDGKGHHHAKYAERLSKFDVNIVPVKENPDFTAAISFDDGVIYISEGFLVDESLFFQLNVLMRHELAHNLLMHQIRMMHKLGIDLGTKVSQSYSLHNIWNVIMDDEISNKKYTDEDKKTVRNMWLNGRIIGGLVTEDHREDWQNLSVEEMYDRVTEEIDQMQQKLLSLGLNSIDTRNKKDLRYEDPITGGLVRAKSLYNDIDSDSEFPKDLDKWIESGCKLQGRPIAKQFQDIIKAIAAEKPITTKSVDELLSDIQKSSITQKVSLVNYDNGSIFGPALYTPEEKSVAVEALKTLRSDKDRWYKKVMQVLSNNPKLDKAAIERILAAL